MTDAQTLAVYAEKAADYAKLTKDQNEDDPALRAFIAAMPEGGHVLDLGCGPGMAAAQMAAAGLSVIAHDPVPQMVAMAARHEGVEAQQASFDDLCGIAVYDGIWANFSLLHAPREEMPVHLSRIAEALKRGGRFHIAVKTGEGSGRDGLGRFYTYYTVEELEGLLVETGFEVLDKTEGRDTGLSGEKAPWVAIAARYG